MNLLLNANVYGWRMTGLLGKNGAWFIGYSRRPANGAAVPALVPREPTQAMLDAADKVLDADPRFIAAAWRAMFDAAGVQGKQAPSSAEGSRE